MLRELGARNTKQIEPGLVARSVEQVGDQASDDKDAAAEPGAAGNPD